VAAASVAPGVQSGSDGVTLLYQTPWVLRQGMFHLRLQISASDLAHEQLRVIAYPRLVTRTDFDAALTGQLRGYPVYPLTIDVSNLVADSSGGVDIDIPVNQAATTSGFPTFSAAAGSGIFPIQIGLYSSDGVARGQPITTYLVYSEPYSATGLPKLSVSLTLPVDASPAVGTKGQLTLPGDQSRTLADLVTALAAHPNVALNLAVTPEVLDALAGGSAVDRTTLGALSQLVESGHARVLPATYAPVPLRGWDAAGLTGELANQLDTGTTVLAGALGAAPSRTTWVVDGGLDPSALATLAAAGTTQLILPDAELSALPLVALQNTFAYPTALAGAPVKTAVYGADPGLTADFSNPGGPVLAANQLLAELAMIQLEIPGKTRGVAVLPPPGWSPDPTFVSTLLAGLAGHPLLSPVTASALFASVPAASVDRSLAPMQLSRGFASGSASTGSASTGSASTGSASSASSASGQPTGSATTSTTIAAGYTADAATLLSGAVAGPHSIRTDRQRLGELADLLPQDRQLASQLGRLLLAAESMDLTGPQRQVLLDAVYADTNQITNLVTLPRASSITLTSTRALVPLTVLSTPGLHARVELRLSSSRLIFHPFTAPEGKCVVPTPTSEICDLTLTTQNTTLKVPVETRTSGVFRLDVALYTVDGALLTAEENTVRSTAVSGVGVILIVVAIVSLALWWIRDLRHGRRARQLVPAPDDDVDDVGGENAGAEDAGGVGADHLLREGPGDADPVVRDFFASSPPELHDPPTRPRP
jgi:hypothetical protein